MLFCFLPRQTFGTDKALVFVPFMQFFKKYG